MTLVGVLALAGRAVACGDSSPQIVAAKVASVDSLGRMNEYHVAVTVQNPGSAAQAPDALQFVDIYENGDKLDAKGVPPLGPGESYTVNYVTQRSADAGNGTSKLTFRLDPTRDVAPCDSGQSYSLIF